jgi:hypothetical protein
MRSPASAQIVSNSGRRARAFSRRISVRGFVRLPREMRGGGAPRGALCFSTRDAWARPIPGRARLPLPQPEFACEFRRRGQRPKISAACFAKCPWHFAAGAPLHRGVLAGGRKWPFVPLTPDRACDCGATAPHRPAGSQRTARNGRRAGLRGPPSARLTLSRARRVAASRSVSPNVSGRRPREQDAANLTAPTRALKRKPKKFYS